MEDHPIGADELRSRFRALRRGGVGPGLPRRRRDAQIFLRAAATAFTVDSRLSERGVGDALKAWLDRAGGRIEMDHVTLRRYLVDGGYLVRDAAGAAYHVRRSGAGQAVFGEDVDEVDAGEIFKEVARGGRGRGPGSGGRGGEERV